MRKAHTHDYQPNLYGVDSCRFPGCEARKNDGQNTGLGQVWIDGEWLDYARDTELQALAWARAKPGYRRVVDWITREVLT